MQGLARGRDAGVVEGLLNQMGRVPTIGAVAGGGMAQPVGPDGVL